jgi:hypothetical protein
LSLRRAEQFSAEQNPGLKAVEDITIGQDECDDARFIVPPLFKIDPEFFGRLSDAQPDRSIDLGLTSCDSRDSGSAHFRVFG